ncbi:leucyl aminopeptidase [Rhodoblastus acidophilus]|uniref:Probable cytosol aminopeptidase n=1 Tax=Candidatus Rhodoblastus alkanivorans TaxID=2954117 RepID=A0ABS9Z771_9HYPH|nr:leucyl aminopeptidase [Candidatus Rhodoblastus alkanivorans]MCI4678748.1 leucyl aminopeptidase [Candidatus Rhodoblastus alkanivorans]MCI4683456.1 leucyl aminopeptidase [Candidatus Rhodoblastus alkanivorans]MDI4640770.1 leucyl aminopeptidase [Rhodoblastus acidophilus]
MSASVTLGVMSIAEALAPAPPAGGYTLVIFVDGALALGAAAASALGDAAGLIPRAAEAASFKGKIGSALDILAPAGLAAQRLLVLGTAPDKEGEKVDYLRLGGLTVAKLGKAKLARILFDFASAPEDAAAAASDFALGLRLRGYKFDQFKTKKARKDDSENGGPVDLKIAGADGAAIAGIQGLADGVDLARTLVNLPPNLLYPESFADKAKELEKLGVEVEILDVPAMEALGMRALLGVGQGSKRPSRVVIMRWNGGSKDAKPVAFIGKGVCFDSGGVSLKPGAGMEDMKGDMAGAACVTGLMHALASRKAAVNAIGAIGLVENMPDGAAQRPGDIVAAMSGTTIEIINTDAEGRLVLADVLWHVQDAYKPAFMIDLATLTGAILVALGQEYAGLFSNNDELAQRLTEAGTKSGEKVWRMPLGPAYDKLIDSKFADIKNTGGRHAGSITAAQFLQRFVNDTPWAHLDIAGTGMAAATGDLNQSWGSGWGVRLLDRLVKDYYEKPE